MSHTDIEVTFVGREGFEPDPYPAAVEFAGGAAYAAKFSGRSSSA
jgi:hypothetical protein